MQTINTQKVIKQNGTGKEKNDIYYIPGFLRIMCKNFIEMDLENLNAEMNGTIIFTVYYGPLSDKIVKELLTGIVLLFGRNDALALKADGNLEVSAKNKEQDRQIQFTVRQVFKLRVESNVFFTPFEIINLILSITVQPVDTQWGTIKINLLDTTQRIVKTSYSEEGTFGNYDLCELKMASEYTNDRVCDVEKIYQSPIEKQIHFQTKQMANLNKYDEKIQSSSKIDASLLKDLQKIKIYQFQYGHFLIPLYKFPSISLATIFLPLWLLAIINLGIFFQDTNMGDRVGSISGIMIAFVALIPTIRDNIPPNPQIVFIEILVYMQSLTSLFVLIDSVSVRNQGEEHNFIWWESGLFMVSFIITLLTVIIIFSMVILHYCFWEPSYNSKRKSQKNISFNRKDWKNELCDNYFRKIGKLRSQTKKTLEALPDPITMNKKKD